eukprot:1143157-Pelagomonas_calceolata.AAC.3
MGISHGGVDGGVLGGGEGKRGKGLERRGEGGRGEDGEGAGLGEGGLAASRGRGELQELRIQQQTEQIHMLHSGTGTMRQCCNMEGGNKKDKQVVRVREEEEDPGKVGWLHAENNPKEQQRKIISDK